MKTLSWSEITRSGIPDEKVQFTQAYTDYLGIIHKISDENYRGGSIEINGRSVSDCIIQSGKSFPEKKSEKKYRRKRKIPQTKNKNYPTKPHKKGDDKVDKKKEEQDYFNWEINHAEKEVNEAFKQLNEERLKHEKNWWLMLYDKFMADEYLGPDEWKQLIDGYE